MWSQEHPQAWKITGRGSQIRLPRPYLVLPPFYVRCFPERIREAIPNDFGRAPPIGEPPKPSGDLFTYVMRNLKKDFWNTFRQLPHSRKAIQLCTQTYLNISILIYAIIILSKQKVHTYLARINTPPDSAVFVWPRGIRGRVWVCVCA